MVDKQNVAFLEDGFYEEIVVEEEVVGDGVEEVITDHYVTEDGALMAGHMDGSLMTLTDPGVQTHHDPIASTSLAPLDQQNQLIIQQQPSGLEDQNIGDSHPRPKHERCRCEARLYIHYHCAICAKPFALGCMLKHFQHTHYVTGTVKTAYAHLIDEERELYGVISYAHAIPNPAHVIKLANGTKRCSNSLCKSKRREGSMEECEHCLAVDDGPPSAPEPIFIEQQILENCHKDFVESYKQYCNSAAQHGVPAVCVLRAPPHVTSHIIYSCFNENNIQKRYLVMQYEPTISCSCGVGAEKACWHRAIVSLCCQAPGQSDNDSLEPPFETLFSVREMQRFIDSSQIDASGSRAEKDASGRASKSGKRGAKAAKMMTQQQQQQMDQSNLGGTAALVGRDSAEIEHAQLLSELRGGVPVHEPTYLGSVGAATQQVAMMIPSSVGAIPTHPHNMAATSESAMEYLPAGSHPLGGASIPELLMAINRLNDTVESLRSDIVTLKSQVAESNRTSVSNYRDDSESMYTITVNGVHNTRSTLEDISRKQVKVIVPSFDMAAEKESASSSTAGFKDKESFGGHSGSGGTGFTVDADKLDKDEDQLDQFEEISEDENDPNWAANRHNVNVNNADLTGRPKRQLHPNRLYNGKEFLVSNKATAPFKPKSN